MNRALLIILCLGLTAGSAHAEEAIATAAGAPMGGAPIAPAPGPIAIERHFNSGDDIVRYSGPCGAPARNEDGKPDKSPHGEVFAGVGTHGYREAGGAVCIPLGDHAAAAIAIDVGQMNGRGWRR